MHYISSLIRDIPDFPKPGIVFKDITPVLGDPRAFQGVIDSFEARLEDAVVDKVVGIEARGFIFGATLAQRLGVGFVPVRKPGKLPYDIDTVSYELEYGTDSLEIHKGALDSGERILIVDDLLATGGTAAATATLIQGQGAVVAGFTFVIELGFLDGRKKLGDERVISLFTY